MGGSSGGGSSGAVSYPAYMESQHTTWLNGVATYITANITATNPYTSAVAYDPDTDLAASASAIAAYNAVVVAFDPTVDWTTAWDILKLKYDFSDLPSTTVDEITTSESLVTTELDNVTTSVSSPSTQISVLTEDEITTLVQAYSVSLLAKTNQNVLPSFQRGMQNVRAVMTSSFTLGEALINSNAQLEIDKYEADLRRDNVAKNIEVEKLNIDNAFRASDNAFRNVDNEFKNVEIDKQNIDTEFRNAEIGFKNIENEFNSANIEFKNIDNEYRNSEIKLKKLNLLSSVTDGTIKNALQQMEYYKGVAHSTIESNRIKIVAKQEETERNIKYEVKDDLWELDLYQYGGNMLASIAGAAASTKDEVSTAQSVLGGAMSGAALGATVSGGNPIAAGIGGVVGGLAGLL